MLSSHVKHYTNCFSLTYKMNRFKSEIIYYIIYTKYYNKDTFREVPENFLFLGFNVPLVKSNSLLLTFTCILYTNKQIKHSQKENDLS